MTNEDELLRLPVGTVVHWRTEGGKHCRPALLVQHFEGFMGAPMAYLTVFEPFGQRHALAYWRPGPEGWHPPEDCAEILALESE